MRLSKNQRLVCPSDLPVYMAIRWRPLPDIHTAPKGVSRPTVACRNLLCNHIDRQTLDATTPSPNGPTYVIFRFVYRSKPAAYLRGLVESVREPFSMSCIDIARVKGSQDYASQSLSVHQISRKLRFFGNVRLDETSRLVCSGGYLLGACE